LLLTEGAKLARSGGLNVKQIVWVPAAITLLASLLVALFLAVYRPSHPGVNWQSQVWDYLGSEQFKIAAVSLGLPILLLFIETQFKIVQGIQQSRQKQAEVEAAERLAQVRRERDERAERRLDTISQTQKMLDDLFDLSIQVVYYKKASVASTGAQRDAEQLLGDLFRLVVRSELAVHYWGLRLGIPDEDQELLLEFINAIMLASDGTARVLRDGRTTPEHAAELQAALEVVVDRCKTICHYPILRIMDTSTRLRQLQEEEGGDTTVQGQIIELESLLEDNRTVLRGWKDWMDAFEAEHDELLAGINEPEVRALRQAVREAEEWLATEAGRHMDDYDKRSVVQTRLDAVPRRTRYIHGGFYYSDIFIKRLADEMLFQFLLERIQERSNK
jgi:hypothetical protein